MFKAKRILVPIDFSPESSLALQWAILFAKEEPHASIELCHVLPNIIAPAGPETMGFDYASYFEREEEAMKEKLEKVQRAISKDIFSSCVIRKGGVAPEIERLCNEKAIDLVIMTTHGRRGLSRFLHGSTTEETVRSAPCPVLVLHMNQSIREVAGAGRPLRQEPKGALAS